MATKEELVQLAAQLAHPSGNIGVELSIIMDRTNSNMTKQAIEALNLQAGQRILELGHGNAGHVSWLLEKHPDVTYVGLDISETMHREAINNNLDAIAAKKASFYLYDGIDLPASIQQVDAIFFVNTIYFIKEPAWFIEQLASLLRPHGKLAITLASRKFMETLPFTAFGFRLYDEAELCRLAGNKLLQFVYRLADKEQISNKAGDLVEREYLTLLWKKI
ncbi:class I SAM-dependent methyltransferase [Sphingobacterium griseoflavum]|uniref:Methyltransferase domain-containing protein n=1 Tax=Sphingobacterium griseoflavum TaxID=1474952 RepID=A0ABQ3I0K0_9SPHI|nr:class I SAM-dependent methyltransferase [Sphingobacterium griseoflavum]GHE42571.1 hypothetical protein GCM10017764_27520 [Sphingobacterium griseoflavum]